MGDDKDTKPAEATFSEPRLAINRVYTRKGDDGGTSLVGGQRLPKDDVRIEAYGTVDELNAFVGVARETLAGERKASDDAALVAFDETLRRVQHELFNLGSILATLPEDVHPKQAQITDADITLLEAEIDRCQMDLAPLRSFVLPGGCRLNADLHVTRTVCRRAERRCVELARIATVDPRCIAYLNRLSDAFFVWSRWVSHRLQSSEVLWDPNRSASGKREGESSLSSGGK